MPIQSIITTVFTLDTIYRKNIYINAQLTLNLVELKTKITKRHVEMSNVKFNAQTSTFRGVAGLCYRPYWLDRLEYCQINGDFGFKYIQLGH